MFYFKNSSRQFGNNAEQKVIGTQQRVAQKQPSESANIGQKGNGIVHHEFTFNPDVHFFQADVDEQVHVVQFSFGSCCVLQYYPAFDIFRLIKGKFQATIKKCKAEVVKFQA